jgi:phage gp46-like protein
MSDITFIYDKQKRHSDIKIVGGDFLLCDSPQSEIETHSLVYPETIGIPSTIVVSGAGTESVNGAYNFTSVSLGRPAYSLATTGESRFLNYLGGEWLISRISGYYKVVSTDILPPKGGWVAFDAGSEPAPKLAYTIPSSTTETTHNVSSLRVAVELSLFTDRRATLDEIQTFQAGIRERQSRRGFWANTFKKHARGSGLWLLQREKKTQTTLARAKKFCTDSLQWLIDEGVVQSITPTVSFAGDALVIHIAVVKPDGTSDAPFRFQSSWDSLEVI